MRVTLDAPVSARLEVESNRGSFGFTLEEATSSEIEEYLDGQASVTGELAATRLTGAKTEDDFSVMAISPCGIWLAYVEYTPGPPMVFDRVKDGNLDVLEPKGHGEKIRLMQFDGQAWHAPLDVTAGQLDVWRPVIAADRFGVLWLAWSQQVDGDWEIYSRRYTPPELGLPATCRPSNGSRTWPVPTIARCRLDRQGLGGLAGLARRQLRHAAGESQ
jgi:hypothetical protein